MTQALSQTPAKVVDVPKTDYDCSSSYRIYGSKVLQSYLESQRNNPALANALVRARAQNPGVLTSIDIWKASDALSREAALLLRSLPIE